MSDDTCYRCGRIHEHDVTCSDARTQRRAGYVDQLRSIVAEANADQCRHKTPRQLCRECLAEKRPELREESA
jgi:hypothetical protein